MKCSVREVPHGETRSIRGLKTPEGEVVFVEFAVTDTGIGMSRDFAKRVFEPFTQERTDGRTTYKGSGLGLAIVKRIVDAMGGVIRLDTELGEGSTFTVILPLECATESQIRAIESARQHGQLNASSQDASGGVAVPAGQGSSGGVALAGGEEVGAGLPVDSGSGPSAREGASGADRAEAVGDADGAEAGAGGALPDSAMSQAEDVAGMRVLLVEDNSLNAEIAQYVLGEAGAAVTLAVDGVDAVETFDGSPVGSFDVVLMDVMMPRMDGLEATRRIRSLARADAIEVPVIGMSANAFSDDVAAAKEAGMDDYVVKPINRDRLLSALKGKARV